MGVIKRSCLHLIPNTAFEPGLLPKASLYSLANCNPRGAWTTSISCNLTEKLQGGGSYGVWGTPCSCLAATKDPLLLLPSHYNYSSGRSIASVPGCLTGTAVLLKRHAATIAGPTTFEMNFPTTQRRASPCIYIKGGIYTSAGP